MKKDRKFILADLVSAMIVRLTPAQACEVLEECNVVKKYAVSQLTCREMLLSEAEKLIEETEAREGM